MRRWLTPLLCMTVFGSATAQQPARLPDRGAAVVAAGRTFVFYSDPVFNLHDFLVWSTFSREPVEPAPDCLAGLPPEQRAAFEHAREHYKVLATPSGNALLLRLRYRLAGFGDFGSPDAVVEAALAELPPAAPAYEKCWWPAHDARNRRWIAALQPLLEANEDALSKRLSDLYGEDLGRPFPVDVVSYGTFVGADSVVNPDHLLVSSIAPAARRRSRSCSTRRRTRCSAPGSTGGSGPTSRRRQRPTARLWRRISGTRCCSTPRAAR